MARAAVSGRLTWRVATVAATRDETATARTLVLDVPGWPGHLAGQHVTARLTAADGYAAQRDYSIASAATPAGVPDRHDTPGRVEIPGRPGEPGAVAAPGSPEVPRRLEITVQRLADGEVSPYLSGDARPGDQFEVRGPIGGWFAWRPGEPRPLLLLAGGSGIVPLMSMIRTHGAADSQVPVQLIYSVRTPDDVIYANELMERARVSPLTVITFLYTRLTRWRGTPASTAGDSRVSGWLPGYAGRLSAEVLAKFALAPEFNPAVFACGPSGFVETASELLVAAGYPPGGIKTERFGPGG
jgi:ferredoxin-NADP reductase